MQQFPLAFEFNERMLIVILDHFNSCLFGTFLCNSKKERHDTGVYANTVSLWTFINACSQPFYNYLYKRDKNTLRPSLSLRKIKLWERYYCRWLDGSDEELEISSSLARLVRHFRSKVPPDDDEEIPCDTLNIDKSLAHVGIKTAKEFPMGGKKTKPKKKKKGEKEDANSNSSSVEGQAAEKIDDFSLDSIPALTSLDAKKINDTQKEIPQETIEHATKIAMRASNAHTLRVKKKGGKSIGPRRRSESSVQRINRPSTGNPSTSNQNPPLSSVVPSRSEDNLLFSPRRSRITRKPTQKLSSEKDDIIVDIVTEQSLDGRRKMGAGMLQNMVSYKDDTKYNSFKRIRAKVLVPGNVHTHKRRTSVVGVFEEEQDNKANPDSRLMNGSAAKTTQKILQKRNRRANTLASAVSPRIRRKSAKKEKKDKQSKKDKELDSGGSNKKTTFKKLGMSRIASVSQKRLKKSLNGSKSPVDRLRKRPQRSQSMAHKYNSRFLRKSRSEHMVLTGRQPESHRPRTTGRGGAKFDSDKEEDDAEITDHRQLMRQKFRKSIQSSSRSSSPIPARRNTTDRPPQVSKSHPRTPIVRRRQRKPSPLAEQSRKFGKSLPSYRHTINGSSGRKRKGDIPYIPPHDKKSKRRRAPKRPKRAKKQVVEVTEDAAEAGEADEDNNDEEFFTAVEAEVSVSESSTSSSKSASNNSSVKSDIDILAQRKKVVVHRRQKSL